MLVLTRKLGEEVYIAGGKWRVIVADILDTCALVSINKGWPHKVVKGESLAIAPGITVTVLRIDADSVRLGFAAPHDVVIDREEIHHLKSETRWRLADAS